MNRPDNNFEDTSQAHEDNAALIRAYDEAMAAASSSPPASSTTRRLSKNWTRLRDDFKTKQILKIFFPDQGAIKPDAELFRSCISDAKKGSSGSGATNEGVELVNRKSGHHRSATTAV